MIDGHTFAWKFVEDMPYEQDGMLLHFVENAQSFVGVGKYRGQIFPIVDVDGKLHCIAHNGKLVEIDQQWSCIPLTEENCQLLERIADIPVSRRFDALKKLKVEQMLIEEN